MKHMMILNELQSKKIIVFDNAICIILDNIHGNINHPSGYSYKILIRNEIGNLYVYQNNEAWLVFKNTSLKGKVRFV